MSPETFIRQNITKALVSEGFPESVALGGAQAGAEHYRVCSQASRKGRIYDDCLARARAWAQGQCPKAERNKPTKEK